MRKWLTNNEVFIWIAGLLYITLVPPSFFPFCLFKSAGLPFCPGCGLGRSIYYLVRGDFSTSWHYHILAFPALVILLHRIFQLFNQYKKHTLI